MIEGGGPEGTSKDMMGNEGRQIRRTKVRGCLEGQQKVFVLVKGVHLEPVEGQKRGIMWSVAREVNVLGNRVPNNSDTVQDANERTKKEKVAGT